MKSAIFSKSGTLTMYKASDSGNLPDWAKSIASVDPEFHAISGVPKESMHAVQVEAITFDELLDAYHVDCVDLLVIDAEGYDKEIIRMIPFDRIKPKIIQFEHGIQIGIMSQSEFSETISGLIIRGYSIACVGNDCIAYI